jgi:MFS family permease
VNREHGLLARGYRGRIKNAALRDPDGRRLIVSQFVAQMGYGLGLVALPWLVLEHGGSAALSGLTITMGLLPYVLFGLMAGAIGDRTRHRKRMLVTAYACQAAAAAIIPAISLVSTPSPGIVLGAAFLIGLSRAFVDAAVFGAIAEIVTPAAFIEAQALLSASWASGQVVGPFAGGALIAAVGAAHTLTVQAGCCAAGAAMVLTIRRPLSSATVTTHGQTLRQSMWTGALVLFRTPMLRLLSGIASVWFFFVMGTQGLLVAYYKDALGFDAHMVGATLATAGIFGVVGSLFISPLSRRLGGARLIAVGVTGSGIAVLGLSLAHAAPSAIPAVALLGLSAQITTASFVGERQRYAEPHMQSRVGLTGRSMVMGASMVGGLTASALSTTISLRLVYSGVAACTLLLALWAIPAILKRERSVVALAAESTAVESVA